MSEVFASIFFTVVLAGAGSSIAASLVEASGALRRPSFMPAPIARARRMTVSVRRVASMPPAVRAAA